MTIRQLVNVVYAALIEGRDDDERRELDLILEGADVQVARLQAVPVAGAATSGQPPRMTPRERLLRSVPTANPLSLVASMQTVASRTGGGR